MGLQEIIRKAIEIGNRTGFITFDQLNEICDGNSLGPEDVEAVMVALSEAEINVTDDGPQGSDLSCSFCGKAHSEVLQLLAGTDALICDECVQLCVQSISTEHPEWRAGLRELLDHLAGKKDTP